MSSDVVLTSALRTNLLSLQNTQSLIDKTQLKLATGLKINSALDGPQSFFAAQSLDNRASDLSRLLDGLSQSIRTIEEADNGITALTSLVEQASSVVSSARDELAASTGEARITGNIDLSDVDLIADTALTTDDTLTFATVDDDGNRVSQSVDIVTGDTAYSLAAKITNAFADNEGGEIKASVTDEGFLSIESKGGRSFTISGGTEVTTAELAELGFEDYFEVAYRGATAGAAAAETAGAPAFIQVVGGSTLSSISLYESSGNIAEAGDLLSATYQDADGNNVFGGFDATDTITITVDLGNGDTEQVAFTTGATATFQDLVDAINLDTGSDIEEYISASFDSATGQLSITSLSDSVKNVQISIGTSATVQDRLFDIGLGDSSGELDEADASEASPIVASETYETAFRFNNSTQALDSLAQDYNNIRTQIDDIVKDAQYRGVNLLQGDDLTTFFNEDNSSKLTTKGANFTADGLGLNAATFRSAESIEATGTEASGALSSVRNFGSSLSNNLSIIQTRQTFTEQTINTLKAGADDLTVADQNEEGANLLALQTRQQLGVTSLSLASQSQQAVLRLF